MSYKFRTPPMAHQLEVFNKTERLLNWAYLLEMGTGKTKITIDIAANMFNNGWIDSLIVFGNKGSYLNWVGELERHLPEHINVILCKWSSDNNKKEWDTYYSNRVSSALGLKVLLMNIEALSTAKGVDAALTFANCHKCLGVVDESTTIKNPKSKRTEAALKVGKACKARRILTGSVVDNSPMNAWSQFQFLKDGMLGFTSFYAFRAEYAIIKKLQRAGQTYKNGRVKEIPMIVGYKNLPDLRKRIANCSSIIKKEDCLDLPEKTYLTHWVDMTAEQTKHYELMKELSLTIVEGELSSSKLALTRLIKFQQIVCGHITDDNGESHDMPCNRLNALIELLEETQGKVVVWALYRRDVLKITEAISREFGGDSVLSFFGDTTKDEREYAKEVFDSRTEGKERFLVSNVVTGGYGNNFTAINTAIYYTNSFDADQRNQSEARIHRIGQHKPVTYVDMLCKDTIDEKVYRVLRSKKDISTYLTNNSWKDLI